MLFILFLQISQLSSSYKCFLHFEILHLTIFLFSWSVGNFQLQNQVKTNCISVLLLKIDKKDRVYHFYIQTMPHLPFEIHSHYSQSSNHLKVLSNSPNWSPMKVSQPFTSPTESTDDCVLADQTSIHDKIIRKTEMFLRTGSLHTSNCTKLMPQASIRHHFTSEW